MLIRCLQAGDAPALLSLYNDRGVASKRTFRALGGETCCLAACEAVVRDNLAEPRLKYDVVAAEDARLAGWGFVWKLRDPDPLFGLVVADDQQRRGLGRRLAEAALAGADALGLPDVRLTVVEDNLVAIGLYGWLGFVDAGGFLHDDGLRYRRMVRRQGA